MKSLSIIIFLLLSNVAFAGPLIDVQDHENLLHELAHGGAAALVVLGIDTVMRFDKDYKKHPIENLIVETTGAIVVTSMYEAITEKTLNEATPRILAGATGGLMVSYQINFNFLTGSK